MSGGDFPKHAITGGIVSLDVYQFFHRFPRMLTSPPIKHTPRRPALCISQKWRCFDL